MPRTPASFDRQRLHEGCEALIGVDEVGRGALAGPVVAAAVRLETAFYRDAAVRRHVRKVKDSKQLSSKQRRGVVESYREIMAAGFMRVAYGAADVAEIERHNIVGATRLAMARAVGDLMPGAGEPLRNAAADGRRVHVLIDGRPLRGFVCEHEAVVGGDARSLVIALASIHAKEWRDALLLGLDERYPGYGFARHKGYGTAEHRAAIKRMGPCCLHRPRFLTKLLDGLSTAKKESQGSLFSATESTAGG
ncbi:MAG: ribonuclease HII [Verrucomicrobia bacterium]|jgi:ribonuclease HII|nr:ribonuclease HII [Verrucomicrobiota bacterium]